MTEVMKGMADIFAFNTLMVRLGIKDLENQDAVYRVRDGEGSSISFLVGHMASSRYGILKALGVTDQNPFAERWGGKNGARDGSEYPDISQLAADWDKVSEMFESALGEITEEQALAPSPMDLPSEDKSLRGSLGFFNWHESYHVGQLGLIRTEKGYQALQFRFYDHSMAGSDAG